MTVSGEDAYQVLDSDLTFVHVSWDYYRTLYATSEDDTHLLNRVASTYFRHMQRMMERDLCLAVARLLDNPKTGKDQRNLVLADLIERAPPSARSVLAKELAGLNELVKPIKKLRNKLFSHRDRGIAFGKPLPTLTLDRLGEVIQGLAAFMNAFNLAIYESETAYDHIDVPGGAKDLIRFFRQTLSEQSP